LWFFFETQRHREHGGEEGRRKKEEGGRRKEEGGETKEEEGGEGSESWWCGGTVG
jgi:hypothetical protein